MDPHTSHYHLAQYRAALEQRMPVDDLIVFGSYADGTATAESDIDVIVVSDAFATMSEDERLRLLDAIATSIHPQIEAWGFTPAEVAEAGELTTLGYARRHGHRFAG